jgi:hypothetical protein
MARHFAQSEGGLGSREGADSALSGRILVAFDDSCDDSTRAHAGVSEVARAGRHLDLRGVVASAIERVAVLAAEAGWWTLVESAVCELARRDVGHEARARVAEVACARERWEVAKFALRGLAVDGSVAMKSPGASRTRRA